MYVFICPKNNTLELTVAANMWRKPMPRQHVLPRGLVGSILVTKLGILKITALLKTIHMIRQALEKAHKTHFQMIYKNVKIDMY